jgi:hypothetical protein
MQAGLYGLAVDPIRGTVVYIGQYIPTSGFSTPPLMWTGSVVSEVITDVLPPSALNFGVLNAVAIDSNGTAVMAGSNYSTSGALIYTLPFGATSASSVSPPNSHYVSIHAVAIGLDNSAVIAGSDNDTYAPLIYLLPSGASEAIAVTLPDPSVEGFISSIAVAPDGTFFLGGQANSLPLLYTLAPGSLVASSVTIPNAPFNGSINSIACASDGTVILVGFTGTDSVIYKIAPNSTSVSAIPCPNGEDITFYSVVIGSNRTAIFAGGNFNTYTPSIFRLDLDTLGVTSIELPNTELGIITSIAINDTNTAVFTGGYGEASNLLLFTLSPTSNVAVAIPTPDVRYLDTGYSVQIYNSAGPYDLRLLRARYYLQLNNTKNKLLQSGIR